MLTQESRSRSRVVVLAASTGGIAGLELLLGALGPALNVPILIVQHMPASFTGRLAARLASVARLPIEELRSGDELLPGRGIVAAGGVHMCIRRDEHGVRAYPDHSAPVNSLRPSADVLLSSVVQVFGPDTLVAVLSGVGSDGLNGCRDVRRAGGIVLAQDEASSPAWGMPGSIVRAGLADRVGSPSELALYVRAHLAGPEPVAAPTPAKVLVPRAGPVSTPTPTSPTKPTAPLACTPASTSRSAAGWTELRALVREFSGIALSDDKEYLAVNRLHPLLKELGIPNLLELERRARSDKSGDLLGSIIDLVATHETSFFRDADVFVFIRDVVLPTIRTSSIRPRIWCAACSSGQEPYSIAMTLLESGAPVRGKGAAELIATDISVQVVFAAMTGTYDGFSISRGLSQQRKTRFFEAQEGNRWKIRAETRDQVFFQRSNLLDDQSGLGTFDLILLRNVLIYFTDETVQRILSRMRSMTRPSGYLILGSSEMRNTPPGFSPVAGISRPIFRRDA